MTSRRTLLALLLSLAAVPSLGLRSLRAAVTPEAAEAFVREAIGHALEALKDDKLGRDERIDRLNELFAQYFDVRAMSLFALGTYARGMSEERRQIYIEAFKAYMVRHYFARLEALGDNYAIEKATPEEDNAAVVATRIGSYDVLWRLRSRDGALKVMDVIVEGSSLLLVQRGDFTDLLQQNNGDIDAIVEIMHTAGRVGFHASPYR